MENICRAEHKPDYCNVCPQNIGLHPYVLFGRLCGPCGLQSCWYGCTFCRRENDGVCPVFGGENEAVRNYAFAYNIRTGNRNPQAPSAVPESRAVSP